jgi:hypothetical protein
MEQTHDMSWIWLLVILATIFLSLVNFYLFLKLLKKYDNSMLVVSEAIEVLSNQQIQLTNDVELIKKNVRMMGNEVKENRHQRKVKN